MSFNVTQAIPKMFSIVSLLLGLAVMPDDLLAQNTSNLTCFNNRYTGMDPNHCQQALRQLVYDANGRLDGLSGTAFVWYQTCVINIKKPQRLQPNRQWVESTVQSIVQACPSSGGRCKFRGGVQAQVYRSTPANVYQINQPVCSRKLCNYKPNDCLVALNKLPVDRKGTFITQNKAVFSSQATWGNCTVIMQTTDASRFRTSHAEVNPSFKRIVSECGSAPGKIYISGGTAGNNGDVRVSTQGLFC